MNKIKALIIIVVIVLLGSHVYAADIPIYTYQVINAYPHDKEAFTQGLVFEGGYLYEGTGQYGSSTLRKVELETGNVVQIYRLPKRFFGEGITLYKNSIIQLTWQSQIGFVYDIQSFSLIREFRYPTEGWGITHDGKHLIMSDGTATLYFLDPETFTQTGTLQVRDAKGPVNMLNELEYIRGEIYANVWQKNCIARISPQTGTVVGWIDVEGLCRWNGVLNGIAYDVEHDRLFVTGKLWPYIYEIKLIEKTK
jgi:glutamine cyclotransferase